MARRKKDDPVLTGEETEEALKNIESMTTDLTGDAQKFKKELRAEVEITPLKDFPPGIHQNEIHIDNIKAGEPVTIPRRFLQNLVTEKVIEKIPK